MCPCYGELGETFVWVDTSAQAATLTCMLQYRDNFTGEPREFSGLLHGPCIPEQQSRWPCCGPVNSAGDVVRPFIVPTRNTSFLPGTLESQVLKSQQLSASLVFLQYESQMMHHQFLSRSFKFTLWQQKKPCLEERMTTPSESFYLKQQQWKLSLSCCNQCPHTHLLLPFAGLDHRTPFHGMTRNNIYWAPLRTITLLPTLCRHHVFCGHNVVRAQFSPSSLRSLTK